MGGGGVRIHSPPTLRASPKIPHYRPTLWDLARLNPTALHYFCDDSAPSFYSFYSLSTLTPATSPTPIKSERGGGRHTISPHFSPPYFTAPFLRALGSESLDFLLISMDIPPANEVDAVGHRGEYRLKALCDTFGLARQIDNQAFAPDTRSLTR